MAITATYVSASSFTVNGDLTADFSVGVRVKADCGADGTKYGTVSNSVYTSLTTVTVTLDSGSLTSNLVGVYHSNDRPISLVNHTHTGAASGGTIGKVDYHGVESGFSSITMVGDVLTIGAATNKYWYQGVSFSTTSAIACDLSSTSARDGSDTAKQTNRLYFIYFKDSTGTLYWSQQQWSLTTKVPVATAYYNGSSWAVSRETHGHTRNLAWHENAHKTIGARYESGLDKTLPTSGTPATLTITSGTIYDEDLAVAISQQTTARAWYQASSGVYTFADIALPYTGSSGAPSYLDTDTYALTALPSNKFGCFWVYASNDVSRPIYIIPTQSSDGYTIISAARAEVQPSLAGLGLSPEIKLLFRWIYKSDGSFQESADYRTASSLPSGFTASTTASSVSFTPTGNVGASTVQSAIEELDSEKIQTTLLTTAGDLIVATAASTPARLGIGSEGQALKVVSGVPGWGDVASGGGGAPTQITNAGFGVWSNGTLESAVSSVNLITNGEFETDTSGWTAGNSATLTRDTTTFQNGSACLKITNTAALNGCASFPIATVAGRVYKLTGYAKVGTNSNAVICAGTTSTGYELTGYAPVTSSSSWTRLEVFFEAIGTTTYVTLMQSSSASTGTSYFDSIILYDMGAKISITNISAGVCTCASSHNLVVGRPVKFTKGSNAAVSDKLYEVAAITDSTHFTLNDSSVNPGATSSTSCTGVIVGCVDYNTKALDLWNKDTTAQCWRETINTKSGAYYALRVYNGSVYWSDGGRAAKPEFYSKYAGRAAAIGVWVRCSSANKARIGITDSAGTTWSSYHSGGGAYEWLEVTRTPGTGITSFNVALDSGTGTEAQFSQPQLHFGTSVGQGNFVPIHGEYISLDSPIVSSLWISTKTLSTGTGSFSPFTDSAGRIPASAVGVEISMLGGDSSTGYGIYMGKSTTSKQLSCLSVAAARTMQASGRCDMIDGNVYYNAVASGSGTTYVSWMQYHGVYV